MVLKRPPENGEILQGTLDMLILRTLVMGPAHGHTIAQVIEHTSENALEVEQGSLYPALHRLEDRGMAGLRVGGEREQSQGKVLQADGERAQGTERRDAPLAQDDARDWVDSWGLDQVHRKVARGSG